MHFFSNLMLEKDRFDKSGQQFSGPSNSSEESVFDA